MTGVVFTTEQVAKALGWSTRRTRRWLRKGNALERVGDRYYTTREACLEGFRGAYEALAAQLPDTGGEEHRCPHCDVLREALLERDRQLDDLARRLGVRRR
jgi:hypothetical protein